MPQRGRRGLAHVLVLVLAQGILEALDDVLEVDLGVLGCLP